MLSRRVLLAVLVLFVSWGLAAQAEPATKPAEKAKPAARPSKVRFPAKAVPLQAVPPEAIVRALEQPIDLEFVETPLADVVAYLQNTAKIPILVDRKAVDDVGVQTDTPVTIYLKGLKLRSALNHMLHNLDLTWIVQDEVLLITTAEQAGATLQTRVYEVGDLVAARDEQLRPYNDFDQLIEMITSTVKPTSWDTVGGPGSIASFEAAGITALVVSQTQQNHEEIDRLLADLRKIKKGSAEPPVRAREAQGGAGNGMGGGAAVGVDGMGESSSVSPAKPQAEPKPAAPSSRRRT